MFGFVWIASLLAPALAPAAPPAGPQVLDPAGTLAPSTSWGSYDEDYRCTVERTFGALPGMMAMKFGRSAFVASDGEILIRGAPRIAPGTEIGLRFGDAPELIMKPRIVQIPRLNITYLYLSWVSERFWPVFQGANRLTVRAGKTVIANAALNGTDAVLRAADACARKQFAAFGGRDEIADVRLRIGEAPAIDLERLAKPATSYQQWFNPNDYPSQAREKGVTGKMLIAWRVGADRAISDCRIIRTSGSTLLDQAGCVAIAKRGAYTQPERDGNGQPVATVGSL